MSAPVALPAAAIVAAAPPPPEPPAARPSPPLDDLGSDAWIHPLDGPARRMPIRDARVFGAERPGDRPAECRGGHCGVDLGGEVCGEPVHAVHDGVVDRVQRDPNDDHGGLYVRLAHRGGTIFTQYFHLAAIPRWLEPGVAVKMGDVIGLVGDTGVKHSTAHLHFTISVKAPRAASSTTSIPSRWSRSGRCAWAVPTSGCASSRRTAWRAASCAATIAIRAPPTIPSATEIPRRRTTAVDRSAATAALHAAI